MRHLVIGTAGHIDHGKSALVHALTGTDPDRLDEEKRRGITIELGFADLPLDDTRTLSFVDVPGHERFVRHMVAGATGIEAVMLVIAADQGIQPQSREHLQICELLGVRRGVVVLTKVDLVDDDLRDVATLEVEEWLTGSFLEGAPIVPVSAKTGVGIEALRAVLADCCDAVTESGRSSVVRLPVDRAFTLRGFGTVVTGTLVGGQLQTGDELEILPSGTRARIRGLQVHRQPVEMAHAGRRVAVNLQGVHPDEVPRGSTLTRPGQMLRTRRAWARVSVGPEMPEALARNGQVRFHQGTTDGPARIRLRRVEAGGTYAAELTFDEPLALAPGDRFVLRRPSPIDTIGGGVVVDAQPPPRALTDEVTLNDPEDLAAVLVDRLRQAGSSGLEVAELSAALGVTDEELASQLDSLESAQVVGTRAIEQEAWSAAGQCLADAVGTLHEQEPLKVGFNRETVRAEAALELPQDLLRKKLDELADAGVVELTGDRVRRVGHEIRLSPAQQRIADGLTETLRAEGLEPGDPLAKVASAERPGVTALVDLLVDQGRLVRLHDGKLFHPGAIEGLKAKLKTFSEGQRSFAVGEFKELAGISRKNAIPLLEHLDATGVTRRRGDSREILL
ncbi:MAG: selenocysteine-specific translation elongation factor [Acidobacteriota bacterium]|nr:selenocysteine-specific translation elongation factor [Acidobacteriota bacterium]MDH3784476.1 selenocysteine-specific translation elongation factor [Acidobacteriota bacterium]